MTVFAVATAIKDEQGDWVYFVPGDKVPTWAGTVGAHLTGGDDPEPDSEPEEETETVEDGEESEPGVESEAVSGESEPDFTQPAPKRRGRPRKNSN